MMSPRMQAEEPLTNELRSDLVCRQMVQDLTEGILSGRLKAGDRLLPEVRLKEQYNISITSVRRGMEMLVRRGIVTRQRGSGTFVCERPEAVDVARPFVRRDTVALCEGVMHPSTHPFFGHMRRRLCSRLEELGWKIRPLMSPPAQAADGSVSHSTYLNVNPTRVADLTQSMADLAGVVLYGVKVEQLKDVLNRGYPYVALGSAWSHPCIAYDWEEELVRALALALQPGVRNVWVVTAYSEKKVAALAHAAAALSTLRDPLPPISHILIHPSTTYSRTTFNAYTEIRERIPSGLPDAIVIHGDFETQGVLDALGEQTDSKFRPPRLVAMINKASQIHSRFSYTALVADGHALGEAAADLLQERIVNPGHAPGFVQMSCQIRCVSANRPTRWDDAEEESGSRKAIG